MIFHSLIRLSSEISLINKNKLKTTIKNNVVYVIQGLQSIGASIKETLIALIIKVLICGKI